VSKYKNDKIKKILKRELRKAQTKQTAKLLWHKSFKIKTKIIMFVYNILILSNASLSSFPCSYNFLLKLRNLACWD
jgi:hypothetical protein